jgi:hypothetical protein
MVTYSRPVGARFLRCELNQGLTPLAINDRRVAAGTRVGRCIILIKGRGSELSVNFSRADTRDSRKQSRSRLRFDQLAWLVQVVVHNRLRADAERMVDRRQDLGRVDRIFQR